jgi:hypothetical protein
MAGKDAGVEALCPGCGRQVLQKEMIPVLAEGGGVAYLCRECARRHIEPAFSGEVNGTAGTEEVQPAAESTPGDGPGAALANPPTRRARRPDRPLRARTRTPRVADA